MQAGELSSMLQAENCQISWLQPLVLGELHINLAFKMPGATGAVPLQVVHGSSWSACITGHCCSMDLGAKARPEATVRSGMRDGTLKCPAYNKDVAPHMKETCFLHLVCNLGTKCEWKKIDRSACCFPDELPVRQRTKSIADSCTLLNYLLPGRLSARWVTGATLLPFCWAFVCKIGDQIALFVLWIAVGMVVMW